MTLILELPPGIEAALAREAQVRGTTPEALALEELRMALQDHLVPQTVAELRPHTLPPSGITAMQAIQGQWPGEETEEQLLAALAQERAQERTRTPRNG